MMVSTVPIVLIIVDVIMVVAGIMYCLCVLLPALGLRLLKGYAPSAIDEPRRKRLAVIRATSFGLVFIVMGVNGLVRDVAGSPFDAARTISVSLLIFLSVLLGVVAQIRLNRL